MALVQAPELYIHGMIKVLLPDLKTIEFVIDHIHRLPKPPFLPDWVPRDVILCIHFFHVKEQLMQKRDPRRTYQKTYAHLQLFADLSQHTLHRHRQGNTILEAMQNHHIQYQWAAPKLAIIYNSTKNIVSSL